MDLPVCLFSPYSSVVKNERLLNKGKKELMIDTAFFQAFVLTFRSFTSGDELMDLLLERYNIQPPPGLNAGEVIDWTKQKQTPIRLRYVFSSSLYLLSVLATRFAASARSSRSSLSSQLTSRVINTIRNLLDIHYLEDQDASMLDRVEQFVEALHAEGATTMATQLSNLVTRRVSPVSLETSI